MRYKPIEHKHHHDDSMSMTSCTGALDRAAFDDTLENTETAA